MARLQQRLPPERHSFIEQFSHEVPNSHMVSGEKSQKSKEEIKTVRSQAFYHLLVVLSLFYL